MPEQKLVSVEVEEVTAETDAAILCLIDGDEVWIPRSQIGGESDVNEEGDSGSLIIPKWLAEDKELDFEELS